jgi:hypothetical protein
VGVIIALSSFFGSPVYPTKKEVVLMSMTCFPHPAPKLQPSVRHGSLIIRATQPYVTRAGTHNLP